MKINVNIWQILSAILTVALLVAIFRPWEPHISSKEAEGLAKQVLIKYTSMFGLEPTILNTNVRESSGFYNISMKVLISNQTMPFNIYISKDGKYITSDMISVEEFLSYKAPEKQEEEMEKIPKSDTPKVDLYIMAFCPFGMKAVKTMIPVYKLLNKSVDFNVHYVIYENYGGEGYCIENGSLCSMHGINELREDMRQLCIAKEYGKDALWEYFDAFYNCGATDECRDQAFNKLSINTSEIEKCMNSSWVVDKLREEKQLNEEYGVRGSPTMLINDVKTNVVYNYGDSDAYKKVICDAFNMAPAECNTTLGSQNLGQGGTC